MSTVPDAAVQASLADEFLPIYDVSDSVGVVVDAGRGRTWAR